MTDLVFRTKQEPKQVEPEKPVVTGPAPSVTNVEPPYLDWEAEKGKPYLVDYFDLGELWDDKVGGFEEEISTIKSYVQDEIEQGRIDNSVGAVKEMLKQVEKQANIEKTDRLVVRIAKIAAYTDFLYKTREIKNNNYKYGHK